MSNPPDAPSVPSTSHTLYTSSAYSSTFKHRQPSTAPVDEHVSAAGDPTSCHFCATLNRSLYRCARCDVAYCGVRCFKSEQHSKCAEDFYKGCVKEELVGKFAPSSSEGSKKPETFEERMEKYLKGEVDHLPGTEGAEEGEPLFEEGEDDEEDNAYLEKVLGETVKGYVDIDEGELERRLTCMGVGPGVEQLMGALSEEERAAFAQLADSIYAKEQGLGGSCFKKK